MNSLATFEPQSGHDLPPRILVADDQVHVLDALQLLLKNQGYCTETVSDPRRVLQALASEQFDLVLMDMNYERDTTAGAEGLELVSQIREKDKNVPVLVMTAWGSVEVAVEAMRRGASDFVQKPWENQQLLGKVQAQVERGHALRRAQSFQEDELQQAQDIQKKLFPKQLPEIADYEIAAMTQPIRFVGGDYYSVVRISESQTVLCIADVAGKGMPAALLMSSMQAALKPLIWQNLPPREVCQRLNRTLCEITPLGKFISLFYGVLNNKEHRLDYCNAGHNSPILVRNQGMTSELNAAGAVLGFFPDWVYEQNDIEIKHGDRLLLFTDGLVEAGDGDGDPFGERNIAAVAQENPFHNAGQLLDELMRRASQHCGGQFQDDASAIVLRAI